jgi:hypothetical protein
LTDESLIKYDAPELSKTTALENAGRSTFLRNKIRNRRRSISLIRSYSLARFAGPIGIRQHASLMMMARSDVVKLEEQLDQWLKDRKARNKGICQIRHALYEDYVNETDE